MSREEVRAIGACALFPVGLFIAPVTVFATAIIYSDFLGGTFGEGMLYGLAVLAGIWTLFYALYKNELNKSSTVTVVVKTTGRNIPQWVKIAVAHRDEGTCRQCGSAYDLQYDHIIPFSLGGASDDVDNIQLLCGRCNRHKGNRYVG